MIRYINTVAKEIDRFDFLKEITSQNIKLDFNED